MAWGRFKRLTDVCPKPGSAHINDPGFCMSQEVHATMVNTGGQERHPGDTARLMEYWAHGAGAAKIQWGIPGDFDRCEVELGKYVSPAIVKGLCSNLHQMATGARPGHAPGVEQAAFEAKHHGKGN